MNHKFNFLYQIRPIYYLPVVCLALTCGSKETCRSTPKPPKSSLRHPVEPNTTQAVPTPTTKPGPRAVVSSNGTASSSPAASLLPATQGSGSPSSSPPAASLPPATQGSGPTASSSPAASLPPATQGSGSPSSSPPAASLTPATQGSGSPSSSPPATQGSESPSSSSPAAQGTASNESLEPVIPINRNENQPYTQERESIEKHIKETVTAIQQKIDKAIDVQATIDGVWHNQQIKLIDRLYDKIQWKGQNTWNNWLRSSEKKDKEEWKNLFKKQTFKEKKEYLTKVSAFLGPHLIHTKNPKVVFKNLECERQDAYKKIAEAAKKNLAFNSDADPKIIIDQALQSLEEYKNKLNEVQKTLPDDTEKFHQRLREVFEAVWEEIEKDTKYKELVNLLNTILVQLP